MNRLIKTALAIGALALFSPMAWSCWNLGSTCTNATGTPGEACKSPGTTPKVCFIDVNTVGCYYVYNSTGKDLFIPTKTVSEFQNFVVHPPTGVSATAGTIGTSCFPSCRMVNGSCPSSAGSSTNPP